MSDLSHFHWCLRAFVFDRDLCGGFVKTVVWEQLFDLDLLNPRRLWGFPLHKTHLTNNHMQVSITYHIFTRGNWKKDQPVPRTDCISLSLSLSLKEPQFPFGSQRRKTGKGTRWRLIMLSGFHRSEGKGHQMTYSQLINENSGDADCLAAFQQMNIFNHESPPWPFRQGEQHRNAADLCY